MLCLMVFRDRMRTKGYGDTMPMADNTMRGRQLNRRVDFAAGFERAELRFVLLVMPARRLLMRRLHCSVISM